MKTKIPTDIQEKANKIIENFNGEIFKGRKGYAYYSDYKGDFLYLNRHEGEVDGPIARLKYSGSMNDWKFSIFKWSSDRYDPEEIFFPGSQHLNGTIEGALMASHAAYPPNFVPSEIKMLDFFSNLIGMKK
jgi:hypothetical protein